MSPRTGRPRTGNQPRISIRMDPEVYRLASDSAKAAKSTLGKWLEMAIRDKVTKDAQTGQEDR